MKAGVHMQDVVDCWIGSPSKSQRFFTGSVIIMNIKPVMAGPFKGVLPTDENEVLVSEISFQGNSLKLGDEISYKSGGQIIKVEAIRLDPTPRVWDGKEWYLLSSCFKGE